MRSHLDQDVQILAPVHRQVAAEMPATDPGFREDIRALVAKLQRAAPDEHLASSRTAAFQPRRPRQADVIDVQAGRRAGVWPTGLVIAAEVLAFAALMLAAVYGPPYYQCDQMKKQGMFYYGTTVRSCVRDKVSARYESVETFLQRTARGL